MVAVRSALLQYAARASLRHISIRLLTFSNMQMRGMPPVPDNRKYSPRIKILGLSKMRWAFTKGQQEHGAWHISQWRGKGQAHMSFAQTSHRREPYLLGCIWSIEVQGGHT